MHNIRKKEKKTNKQTHFFLRQMMMTYVLNKKFDGERERTRIT